MFKYAKRCSSEVNENIFERIVDSAADAWRARALASPIRLSSNSESARLLRLCAGMFRPKNFPVDPERFLKERFSFGVLAHVLVQLAQVIEAGRGDVMFRAQDLLVDPERFLVERLCSGVLAHVILQHGQVVEAGRRVNSFWPKNLLPNP
jgi:hypothetical protein